MGGGCERTEIGRTCRDPGQLLPKIDPTERHSEGGPTLMHRIVERALENRILVILVACLFVIAGSFALKHLTIDAVPDITNVQVQILTKSPSLGPVEIERFITYPVEAAMNGLPRLSEIRSVSRYGLSSVTVIFEENVNIYFARQLVSERLNTALEAIPENLGR